MIVDIFIPCYIDQFYPRTAESMVKVLEKLGCGVNYNVEQTCCGRPAFEDGYRDHCKEIGEKLIKEFQDERYIVSPGASCVSTVKTQYPALFHNSALHNEYKLVQKNIFELSDFIVNILNVSDTGSRYETKAVFLDSCAAIYELGIKEAPRHLLSKVRGLELIELDSSVPCCGMSSGFDKSNEAIIVQMANDFISLAKNCGAQTIISTDYQCLMHLEAVIKRQKELLKVVHIADVLASGWE